MSTASIKAFVLSTSSVARSQRMRAGCGVIISALPVHLCRYSAIRGPPRARARETPALSDWAPRQVGAGWQAGGPAGLGVGIAWGSVWSPVQPCCPDKRKRRLFGMQQLSSRMSGDAGGRCSSLTITINDSYRIYAAQMAGNTSWCTHTYTHMHKETHSPLPTHPHSSCARGTVMCCRCACVCARLCVGDLRLWCLKLCRDGE